MSKGRAAALAVGLALIASRVEASAVAFDAPPMSPETEAAIAKVRNGDVADLRRLAEAGKADALLYFGILTMGGAGVPQDGPRGCAMVAKAAATRSDAMHVLGECYQYGYGGEKDLEKAIVTFHKAGDMGLAKSRCAEGNVLFALGREEARAFALCREAAERGDPDAQTDVGNFYLMGNHVAKDVTAARQWYEKAVASSRQKNAAFILGQIYWNGDGVAKDNAKAASYWHIAYEGGRSDAAFHLGNEAFVRARKADKKWDLAELQEARGWYAKAAVEDEDPAMRSKAVERRDFMDEITKVMQRQR